MYGTAQLQLGSGHAGVLETKWRSSVLLVNVFVEVICGVNYQYHASSTAADRIPIVGAAKSLVPKGKRFSHTKVWCTFIFIDLQATGDCEQRIYILYAYIRYPFDIFFAPVCVTACDLMVLIVIVSTMNRPLSILNCSIAYNLSEILL